MKGERKFVCIKTVFSDCDKPLSLYTFNLHVKTNYRFGGREAIDYFGDREAVNYFCDREAVNASRHPVARSWTTGPAVQQLSLRAIGPAPGRA